MQENIDEGNRGSYTSGTSGSQRILEDSDGLKLFSNDRLIAVLSGKTKEPELVRLDLFTTVRLYYYERFDFGHLATIRLLQGENILDLYGFLVLQGYSRSISACRMGFDDVVIAEIVENSEKLSMYRIFSMCCDHIGCPKPSEYLFQSKAIRD